MPLINRREAPQIFGSLSSVFLKKVGDLIKKESPKPYISKAWRFRECIYFSQGGLSSDIYDIILI